MGTAALAFLPGPAAEEPRLFVFESEFMDLALDRVKVGDWIEYKTDSPPRQWRVALVKVEDGSYWIETNRIFGLGEGQVFLARLQQVEKLFLIQECWVGKPGETGTPVKFEKSKKREWTKEEKEEFEKSKPKITNRKGQVLREKIKVGTRELDCEKVVMDEDWEERGSRWHDTWTTWQAEGVPAFDPANDWKSADGIAWEGERPKGVGAKIKMSRASDGKLRYTNTLVDFGNDAKQTLKLPEPK